jgi:hypothetical protein
MPNLTIDYSTWRETGQKQVEIDVSGLKTIDSPNSDGDSGGISITVITARRGNDVFLFFGFCFFKVWAN